VKGFGRLRGLEGHMGFLLVPRITGWSGERRGGGGRHQLLGTRGVAAGVIDQLHPLDLVGGAEAVEEVHGTGTGRRKAGGGGDRGEVAASCTEPLSKSRGGNRCRGWPSHRRGHRSQRAWAAKAPWRPTCSTVG